MPLAKFVKHHAASNCNFGKSVLDKKWINLGTKLASITDYIGGFFSKESNLLKPTAAKIWYTSLVSFINCNNLGKSLSYNHKKQYKLLWIPFSKQIRWISQGTLFLLNLKQFLYQFEANFLDPFMVPEILLSFLELQFKLVNLVFLLLQ